MTKLNHQNVAKLPELPDFDISSKRDLPKAEALRYHPANHPPKCLYHSTCPLIQFWRSHVRVGSEELS